VHGAAHHHGTVFVAAIAGLWIAWPTEEEVLSSSQFDGMGMKGAQALLLLLCGINIWDSAVVIEHEYAFPYSGGKDAADYLRAVGAHRQVMFGFIHGITAIQAYYDHNIFANTQTAYYHHGLPLNDTLHLDELYRQKPEYVVAYSDTPNLMLQIAAPELTANGYSLVHFSDGYYLYKRGVYERETYFIFRRNPGAPSSLAAPSAMGRDWNHRQTP